MQAKGVSSLTSLADKIVFCQPGVVGGWLAAAPVNHWQLSFNDKWCMSHSASMHEMGHSLGLLHSGKGDDDYGDESGYMGYGAISANGPLKCFNAIKSWQLGWYSDRAVQVSSSSPTKVDLAGVVNYGLTTSDHAVLVNVDSGKYYMLYNQASLANSETGDAVNKVAIVAPVSSGSRLLAQLDVSNPRFTVNNYSNGNDLVVQVCHKSSNGGVDSIVLTIGLGQSYCNDNIPVVTTSSVDSSSIPSSSGSTSLAAAVSAAICKSGGEDCSSDAQCCGDAACLGPTSATRKCSPCLALFDSCSNNNECCGGMKCSSGYCRAAA
jgi:hypothetical protein